MFSSKDVNVNLLNSQSLEATGSGNHILNRLRWQTQGHRKQVKGNLSYRSCRMESASNYWIEGKGSVPILSLFLQMCKPTVFFYLDQQPKLLFNLLTSDNIFFNYILPCFQMRHI